MRPAGTGRTRIRSSSSTRRRCSTASRRRVLGHRRGAAAAVRRRGSRSGPGGRRSRTTTTTSCIAASSVPGRVTFLGGSEYHADGAAHLVTSRVSGETVAGRRAPPGRRRHLPVTDDPRDDAAAVRRCRRRPRRRRSTSSPRWPTAPSSYVIVGSGKTATDGIVWLLANGVDARPHRVGAAARPVDAQPRGRPARPGGGARACGRHHGGGRRRRVARRPVPAPRSCRRDAPDRHRRRSHDGQDADARRVGARAAPHHRERRSPRTHQARDARRDRASTTGRFRWRRARSCALRGVRAAVPAAGSRSGARTRSGSRRSGPASRASTRRCSATWRQPATTIASATGCARPTPSPTTLRTGRGCRFGDTLATRAVGAEPDIAAWANACALNPARIEASQRDDPAVQAALTRLAEHAERGLARMAELAGEPLA